MDLTQEEMGFIWRQTHTTNDVGNAFYVLSQYGYGATLSWDGETPIYQIRKNGSNEIIQVTAEQFEEEAKRLVEMERANEYQEWHTRDKQPSINAGNIIDSEEHP